MRAILRVIFASRFLPVIILVFGLFISFVISSTDPKPNKGIEIPKPVSYTHLTLPTNREV